MVTCGGGYGAIAGLYDTIFKHRHWVESCKYIILLKQVGAWLKQDGFLFKITS